MTEDEKLIHLSKIREVQDYLRPNLIAISISIVVYAISMIIFTIELFRVGPFDARIFGWALISLIAYSAAKINEPPQDKLNLYKRLVKEYRDKNYNK